VKWDTYIEVKGYNTWIMAGSVPEGYGHQVPDASKAAKFWVKQSPRTRL
jgi:hypothetical protein